MKKRVWLILSAPVRAVASAIGWYSPACGHWRADLVDGLCFDCAVKRIELRPGAPFRSTG